MIVEDRTQSVCQVLHCPGSIAKKQSHFESCQLVNKKLILSQATANLVSFQMAPSGHLLLSFVSGRVFYPWNCCEKNLVLLDDTVKNSRSASQLACKEDYISMSSGKRMGLAKVKEKDTGKSKGSKASGLLS